MPDTAKPTRVNPRCAIAGAAAATSCRAAARMGCVDDVAHGNVRDRVARLKSSNRSRAHLGGRHAVAGAAQRALGAHGPATHAGRHPAAIDVAAQRIQLAAHRGSQQRGQRRLAELGDVGDGHDAVHLQLLGGHRTHAPQPADR
jgi:hypothetical protein